MKKILLLSLLLLSIITIGCSKAPAPSQPQGETESAEPSEDNQINQGAIGGHSFEKDYEYDILYYGPAAPFTDLIKAEDPEGLAEWRASFDNPDGTTNYKDITMIKFIQRFDIPKEVIVSTNNSYQYPIFTDEQIEALYSNDKKLLADNFMNPNAVRVGDEIYLPKWVATHTLDELKAAGITESILEAKCSEWKETFGESSDVYTGAKALLDQYQAETEPTE